MVADADLDHPAARRRAGHSRRHGHCAVHLHTLLNRTDMAQFNKLARWYTTTAFLLLNTIILFIILNLVLQLAMSTWHSAAKDNDKPSHGFSAESLRKVYPNLSDAERTE